MSPPYFPIGPTELEGDWTFTAIAPGEQRSRASSARAGDPPQGGPTFGYRVSDGHSTLTYMPDHCPTALGPGEDGFGEYHPAALELAHGADVLVHDAQLFPEELAIRRALRPRRRRLRGRARQARTARGRSSSSTTATTAPTRRSTGSPSVSAGALPHVIVAEEGAVLDP